MIRGQEILPDNEFEVSSATSINSEDLFVVIIKTIKLVKIKIILLHEIEH